jgi:O-antigen/teichoic acid export membrane protein
MTGTFIAQCIPLAISPIITRIYTPEDFGVFAVYISLFSVLSVLVTGRYELAIMLPKNNNEAMHLVVLSVILTFMISAILLGGILVFHQEIIVVLGSPEIGPWLYWVPFSTLLMGGAQTITYWNFRQKNYKRISQKNVIQSATGSSFQLSTPYFTNGPLGLLTGNIAGQFISTSFLIKHILKDDLYLFNKFKKIKCLAVAKKYIKFPKFMIIGQLANILSSQLPLLLINAFFGPAIAGLYALSERTLAAPMTIIASAIGNVFRQEALEVFNKKGNCIEIYMKTLLKLLVASIFLMAPIFFFGPWLFSIVFGEQWRASGEIASIVSVLVLFQTVSSPLSQTVIFAGLQRIDMIWQIIRLLSSIGAFYIGYIYFSSYIMAITLHVISFSILYVFHSMMQYYVAKGKYRTVNKF